jgi:fructose-1,6-bisphosphate aldolase, class II, various bacterial and amitochondriate protist
MLVNMKEMLKKASDEGYAVPHLNINNLEWTRFILEECERLSSPVILGVSEGAANYMGGFFTVASLVKGLIKDLKITVPVALHLDHGRTFLACKEAIDAGFTSVMIDASKQELNINIEITKEVVEYAKEKNISVEAEVGQVGGEEDGVVGETMYARVEDCIKMTTETDIDTLAPALGSVHGLYKGEPKLNFERMKEVKEKTKLPLVLHGGTGIPDDMIKKSIEAGINKINVNTELQIAWTKEVKTFVTENNAYDPRKVIKSGEEALKKCVENKVTLFGSYKKA